LTTFVMVKVIGALFVIINIKKKTKKNKRNASCK
jgi:hypothetical protein